MTQREKVIKELECCVSLSHNGSKCANCDYADEFRNGDCETYLLRDALALLKAQEPMLVKHTTSTIRCPKCNKQITSRGSIHKEIKYCWKCGQAVKWDG